MNRIQKYFLYKKLMHTGPAGDIKYNYTGSAVTEIEWICKCKDRSYIIRSSKLVLKYYVTYTTVVLMSHNIHDVVAYYDHNTKARKLFERASAAGIKKTR